MYFFVKIEGSNASKEVFCAIVTNSEKCVPHEALTVPVVEYTGVIPNVVQVEMENNALCDKLVASLRQNGKRSLDDLTFALIKFHSVMKYIGSLNILMRRQTRVVDLDKCIVNVVAYLNKNHSSKESLQFTKIYAMVVAGMNGDKSDSYLRGYLDGSANMLGELMRREMTPLLTQFCTLFDTRRSFKCSWTCKPSANW